MYYYMCNIHCLVVGFFINICVEYVLLMPKFLKTLIIIMLRNSLQWLNAQHLSGITAFGSCSNCELSLFA